MPDGRIEVQDPENFLFITKGLPPGAKTLEKNDDAGH
jgi:hypothetical protein